MIGLITLLVVLAILLGYLLARAEMNTDGAGVYPLLAAMAAVFLMLVDVGFIHRMGGFQ